MGSPVAQAARPEITARPELLLQGLDIRKIGVEARQSPIIQRQIIILNTINLLIVLPVWSLLTASHLITSQSLAASLLGTAISLIITMLILRSYGGLGLGAYWHGTFLLVFFVPISLSLLLGGNQHSGLVIVWSYITPTLAILLDQPRAASAWFALLLGLNGLSLLTQTGWNGAIGVGVSEDWIIAWQAFNRLGISSLVFGSIVYLTNKHKQAIDHLDHYAALVAHELRNPLTSITLGLGHGLRQLDRLSETQKLALETAHKEAKRCQLILNDLLALSRGHANQFDLSLQTIDPYAVLKATADQAGRHLGLTIQLQCPLQENERLIWVDPTRLVQIIENLIENSAKYADPTLPIDLSISASPFGQDLLIQLADRGETLTAEDCRAIFIPFYRASNANDKKGSGLGLTVVRRLVTAMGGSVNAEAREGGGLRVTLKLALALDRRSKQPASQSKRSTSASQNSTATDRLDDSQIPA